ncbi:hypothetical protein, partial [Brevibacillus brevis]|uniref:hypothetical protein n=1 Tax=Brevibacillus brevis TaxID=1393 RepID=UPI00115941C7
MKRFLAIIVAVSIFMFGAQTAGLLGTISKVSAEESVEKKIKSLIVRVSGVSAVAEWTPEDKTLFTVFEGTV